MYTKGEWKSEKEEQHISIMGEHGYVVATINEVEGQQHANAQLISASPDLLFACKRLLAYVEELVGYQEGHEIGTSIRRICKKAIAKAEGKTE